MRSFQAIGLFAVLALFVGCSSTPTEEVAPAPTETHHEVTEVAPEASAPSAVEEVKPTSKVEKKKSKKKKNSKKSKTKSA